MGAGPPVRDQLEELHRRWASITDVPEQPRSVMNVVEYGLGQQRRAEVYVNRLLRYFLAADESHGMQTDFLRAFLEGLPEACDFQEDLYDLEDVQVSEQASVTRVATEPGERDSQGWLDLLIQVPEEWYLLVELKFAAEETGTTFYCNADEVGGRSKSAYESGAYYLYLHQGDKPQASGPCFVNWTWEEFVADVVEPLLLEHGARFPQRTTNQLREFTYDICEIIGMSDHEQSEREKADLFVENYDAISDVSDAFESQWDAFAYEWPQRLTERIDDPAIENEWVFWEYADDWAYLYKRGWWRRVDTFKPISEPTDPNRIRVGFLHRLDQNRDLALGEHTLKFYFRNTPPNRHTENDETNFRDAFVENFEARREEISTHLPERATLTGNMHNTIEATYDIPVAKSEDFFTALHTAYEEHVIHNPQLVELLDAAYEETLERFQ